MAGEIVKARKTLEQLRDEIVVVAKDLGVLYGDVESHKASKAQLEKDILILEDQKKNTCISLAEKQKQLDAVPLLGARTTLDSLDVSQRNTQGVIVQLEKRRDMVIDEITYAEKIKIDVSAEVEGQISLSERLSVDIKDLLTQKVVLEHGIVSGQHILDELVQKQNAVLGAIKEAMDNFRIFERRISMFSEETGYLVAYKKPQELLDKK